MTYAEIDEEFDNRAANLMMQLLINDITQEQYEKEMEALGEWFDAECEKIQDRDVKE